MRWYTGIILVVVVLFLGRKWIYEKFAGVEAIPVSKLSIMINKGEKLHILDLRTEAEFSEGHIEGAVNIPISTLNEKAKGYVEEVEGGKIAVICANGNNAMIGATVVKRSGAGKVYTIQGGMEQWIAKSYPVVK